MAQTFSNRGTDKLYPWLLAARPKTLTAAFVPVAAGSALAWSQWHNFDYIIFLSALLGSLFIQLGTNLINDALDFQKGADNERRLGPVRVTQSGLIPIMQVLRGGYFCFAMAVIFGIPLVIKGGLPIMLLLIVSVFCGYLYTGGPKPLAYCGLGDVFVFLFFGLVSTCAVYYLQSQTVNFFAVILGVQIGFLATVLIAINNLRDYQEDGKASKNTMAVRFGKTFARIEISTFAIVPFLLNLWWLYNGYLMTALLPFLSLPIAYKVIREIWKTEPGREYNQILATGALLHLVFGILLTLTFLIPR